MQNHANLRPLLEVSVYMFLFVQFHYTRLYDACDFDQLN